MDRSSPNVFVERRRNRGNVSFPILDILSRSVDIRVHSQRLYKIDRNFACFWPQIFFRPPNFWTCAIKWDQFPIMWQSFTAIGRGTLENAWRNFEKKHINTRWAGQSPTWGRPSPQVRVESQCSSSKFLSQQWQLASNSKNCIAFYRIEPRGIWTCVSLQCTSTSGGSICALWGCKVPTHLALPGPSAAAACIACRSLWQLTMFVIASFLKMI